MEYWRPLLRYFSRNQKSSKGNPRRPTKQSIRSACAFSIVTKTENNHILLADQIFGEKQSFVLPYVIRLINSYFSRKKEMLALLVAGLLFSMCFSFLCSLVEKSVCANWTKWNHFHQKINAIKKQSTVKQLFAEQIRNQQPTKTRCCSILNGRARKRRREGEKQL